MIKNRNPGFTSCYVDVGKSNLISHKMQVYSYAYISSRLYNHTIFSASAVDNIHVALMLFAVIGHVQ